MLPDAARQRQVTRARLIARAILLAEDAWARLDQADWRGSFTHDVAPYLLRTVTGMQLLAATGATSYVTDVLDEQGIDGRADGTLRPRSVAGVASDGRPLLSLLAQPLIATLTGLSAGDDTATAREHGLQSLLRIVTTQVADAGRASESVEMTARRAATGYMRVLNTPSCARCAILAGRFYRWNEGFSRHPKCDCYHVPTNERAASGKYDSTTDPRKAFMSGRVTGLSGVDLHAIVVDGADPSQIVNAHRGMSTTVLGGQRLKTTREGLSRRGQARATLGQGRVRLRPEAIYQVAGDDRAEAIRLLRVNGYLT